MEKIVLVGFMGSGKSTIGWNLSKQLNVSFFEMDKEIEKQEGQSISDIFATKGEAAFRELESKFLRSALKNGGVISTGGGILMSEDNRALLEKEEKIVYLKGSIDILLKNITKDKTNRRPLAERSTKDEMNQLLASREANYESVADMIIEIDDKSVIEIVEEIMNELGA